MTANRKFFMVGLTGEKKAHGPTGTRTQDLSHTVQALWPLSYRATQSACDSFPLLNVIRPQICSEPCRSWRDSPFAARSWLLTHTLSHQMSQERKKHMARLGLKCRTSGIPCHASTLTTKLPNHKVNLWQVDRQKYRGCGYNGQR